MIKHFIDKDGNFAGSFVGHISRVWIPPVLDESGDEAEAGRFEEAAIWPKIPADLIEVAVPPQDARQKWNGEKWLARVKTGAEELEESETLAQIARKLEDVIDHIENGTPLSEYAKSWSTERKTARSRLKK